MDAILDTITWFIKSPFLCIGWIIVGFIAGALARQLMGSGDEPFFKDIILGIAGSIVGGWVVGFLGVDVAGGGITLLIINLIVATIGAAILIAIGRALFGTGRSKARN